MKRKRIGILAAAVGLPALLALGALLSGVYRAVQPVPQMQGAPVAVRVDGADRVLLVTRHEVGSYAPGRSSYRSTHYVSDLWSFDAATAQPLWRQRLPLPRKNGSAVPIGTDDGVLWLFVNGLLGVSTRDGTVLADAQRIEARNPELRGLLPAEERWYRLDRGLVFTAADARVFRLDAGSLRAQRLENADAEPQWDGDTQPPAHWTPSATYAFQKGGIERGDAWLGLLAQEEYALYRERQTLPTDRASIDKRVRLYRAQAEEVSAAPPDWPADFPDNWGKRRLMRGLAPLPEKTDYLDGGLLSGGTGASRPLLLPDPDSLLILHRDRLGEEGRLQLARVDLEGRPLWNTPLPLSILQSLMRFDDRRLLLFGRAYTPNPEHRLRDPYHDAQEWLLSLDLASGELRGYNLAAGTALP